MSTEYHDPDGVFPLLWPQLSAHIPLRNLYWKSSTRPLRSIAALDIEFVQAVKQKPLGREVQSDSPQVDRTSSDSRSNTEGDEGEGNRRHQIPGLRSTPYLKLYLLRCDDKDLYKATFRPKLREWVKEHVTNVQSSGSYTNHDAFEWLILHVVLPDTAAAAQPRFGKKRSEVDGPKERSSKWPGKSGRPLLEKLRADFNESGKSGFERVAQIRLARDAVPPGLLRASLPEGITPINESPQEQQAAWNDLITKLKALIMAPFNLRVSQYEEDVRERELQRSLPGWNFCTFFVLKEGLARAFEAVGLTEDALLGYDELSVGLDSTIRDQLLGHVNAQTSRVPMRTSELHTALRGLLSQQDSGQAEEVQDAFDRAVLDASTKDYRGLIVSNAISVFDFRCYIFLRQMTLLLKLARLAPSFQSPKTALARLSTDNLALKNQDAVPLTELSQRATLFASLISRTMKEDLLSDNPPENQSNSIHEHAVIALVSSWLFGFLEQILDETVTSAIATPTSMRETKSRTEPVRTYSYPRRQSSLPTTLETNSTTSPSSHANDELFLHDYNLKDLDTIKNLELANAAACRGDLLLRQRNILEQLGVRRGWYIGLLSSKYSNGDIHTEQDGPDAVRPPDWISAICNSRLRKALISIRNYRTLHEVLSDHAAWHYAIANRTKSAEQLVIGQALLKFDDGDYAAAATYFNKLATQYGSQDWSNLEITILMKYAECLRMLNRKDELARVRLAVLAKKATAAKRSLRTKALRNRGNHSTVAEGTSQAGADVQTDTLFERLVADSKGLSYDVVAKFSTYFELLRMDTYIEPSTTTDGFRLSVSIRQLLAKTIAVDDVKILLSSSEVSNSREIWLQYGKQLSLGVQAEQIWINSNINTYCKFRIARIIIQTGRVSFVSEDPAELVSSADEAVSRHGASKKQQHRATELLIYPRAGALTVCLAESPTVYVNRGKSIVLTLDSGVNEVQSGVVALRSATAGLRLHTAKLKNAGSQDLLSPGQKPGQLVLAQCPAHSRAQVEFLYQVDQNASELFIKVEVVYQTAHGESIFQDYITVKTIMSLDVSVQESIKADTMFPTFCLRPMTGKPMILLSTQLEGTNSFTVQPLLHQQTASLITSAHPSSTAYRISHAVEDQTARPYDDTQPSALVFQVQYHDVLDGVIADEVNCLKEDVQDSPFSRFSEMLVHSFEAILRDILSKMDHTDMDMISRIRLPPYEALEWAELHQVASYPEEEALVQWVRGWYMKHSTLEIPTELKDQASEYTVRELVIDFEMPRVDYLFIVSITLQQPSGRTPMVLGSSQAAQVHLSYSGRWSSQQRDRLSFVYEIDVEPDTWLFEGQRQASFEAEEGQSMLYSISLTPLKTGQLPLPEVRVRLGEESRNGNGEVSLQVNLGSRNDLVTVIEGLRSATLAIGSGDTLADEVRMLEASAR